jgi:hypothetical protein
LKGHERGLWSVAISPDDRTIVAGDEAGNFLVWRASGDELLSKR